MSSTNNNNKPDKSDSPDSTQTDDKFTRRNLLKGAGVAAAGSLTSSALIAADSPASAAPQKPLPQTIEALEVLTAEEAQVLEVICDCLIPSDENGPGAREARAVHYIDRSLASHNASDRQHYLLSLSAINDYARKTRGKAYHELIRDIQDSILLALQEDKIPGCSPSSSGFFNLVRSDAIDGTFCDPYYGGNQNFVGWDLLGYPGIHLSASETDVANGPALAPNHQSAYDNVTFTKMANNALLGRSNRGGRGNA